MSIKLLQALQDCVSVMANDLKGMAIIQPELEQAQKALADHFRPVEWDGVSLPPVGTVCEFAGFNPEETLPTDPLVGDKVSVIAHFKSGNIEVAAFTYHAPPEFEYLQVAQGAYGCFRPIRTAEQIAAEERISAAYAMCAIAPSLSNADAASLYDALYRKQVAP